MPVKEVATPIPAPALSTQSVVKWTLRGFLANALQKTVPILREEKSTIARRSKFTGSKFGNDLNICKYLPNLFLDGLRLTPYLKETRVQLPLTPTKDYLHS